MDNIVQQTNDRVRFFPEEGDIKFRVVATDPYGFWHIEAVKGATPKKLSNSVYTTQNDAFREITRYLNHKKEEENKPPRDKNLRKVLEVIGEIDGDGNPFKPNGS